jgi:hypothetical protein
LELRDVQELSACRLGNHFCYFLRTFGCGRKSRRFPAVGSLCSGSTGVAIGQLDLPSVKAAPVIAFASKEQLSALRMDGGLASADVRSEPTLPDEAAHDRVVAVYDRSSETILLPLGWTGATSAEQSSLVHELVHHLQNVAQTRFECPMAAEKLAYLAQDRWLERSGSSLEKEFELDKFTILISSACFF